MNETVQNGNNNPQNVEIEEVVVPAEGASQEEKDEYVKKLESNNKQLFARAKKAEGFIQDEAGKWVKPSIPAKKPETESKATIEKTSELSSVDVFTLVKADVHQDDIEKVTEYAKFAKVSVAEALASPIVKGILAESKEKRLTAEGTNVSGGRRGNSKVTDEALLENARKGIYPESDEDIRRLTILKRKNK